MSDFIFWQGIDDKVLIEFFLEGGREFTTIVLDVSSGNDCQPVALLPTEVYASFIFRQPVLVSPCLIIIYKMIMKSSQ